MFGNKENINSCRKIPESIFCSAGQTGLLEALDSKYLYQRIYIKTNQQGQGFEPRNYAIIKYIINNIL